MTRLAQHSADTRNGGLATGVRNAARLAVGLAVLLCVSAPCTPVQGLAASTANGGTRKAASGKTVRSETRRRKTRAASPSKKQGASCVSRTQQPPTLTRRPFVDRTEQDVYRHEFVFDDDTEDDLDALYYNPDITSFQELQRSTGPEIVDDTLQTQIDQLRQRPVAFLDAQNATHLEKIAMSSIPQQLPKPVLDALGKDAETPEVRRRTRRSRRSSRNDDGSRTEAADVPVPARKSKATPELFTRRSPVQRLTHEQELTLGRMIQKGAALDAIRQDLVKSRDAQANEDGKRTPLTRQDWAKAAGIPVKELRRTVANYRNAKQYLVQANIGLVHTIVKQQVDYKQHRSGITYDELVQEGSLGLIRAAELFDPSRGLRFSTYATIWIKGQLSNSNAADLVKIPRRDRDKWKKVYKAEQELKLLHGDGMNYAPTIQELAAHTGFKAADIVDLKTKMDQTSRPLSLDYEYDTVSRSGNADGRSTNERFLADEDLAEITQLRADLIATMARNLDAREARLMRLQYGLSDNRTRTLRECAEAMGLSYTRVQQISKICLQKLREAEDAQSLQEYLLTIA